MPSARWDKTIVQTCIVHYAANSFHYASWRDWEAIACGLKPVYTAASEAEALDKSAEFSSKWEARYLAIIRLRENAWAEFVPFLQFDREIRTVICTNASRSTPGWVVGVGGNPDRPVRRCYPGAPAGGDR
jgi:putative transposase